MTEENLLVAGISQNILFYKFDGASYVFDLSFFTFEPSVYKMNINYNFTKFAYGGDSGVLRVYVKNNDTYEEEITINAGGMIYTVNFDEGENYYLVTTDQNKLLTYYKCPS